MYKTKAHYEANKEYYISRARERKIKIRKLIDDIKSQPCMDCGKSYPPYVMDFDHREDKIDNVAVMIKNVAMKKLMDEIAKCDIVCANCHRIRTYQQK